MEMTAEVLSLKVRRNTLWIAFTTLIGILTSTIIITTKIDKFIYNQEFINQTTVKTLYDHDLRIKANTSSMDIMTKEVDKIGYDLDNYKNNTNRQ